MAERAQMAAGSGKVLSNRVLAGSGTAISSGPFGLLTGHPINPLNDGRYYYNKYYYYYYYNKYYYYYYREASPRQKERSKENR